MSLICESRVFLTESIVIESGEDLELQPLFFVDAEFDAIVVLDSRFDGSNAFQFHLHFIDKRLDDIALVKTDSEFRSKDEVICGRVVRLDGNLVSGIAVSLKGIASAEVHHDGIREFLSPGQVGILNMVECCAVNDAHLVTDAVRVLLEHLQPALRLLPVAIAESHSLVLQIIILDILLIFLLRTMVAVHQGIESLMKEIDMIIS